MYRALTKALVAWSNDPLRMPLILRGPRQVGKSWLVQSFGKEYFENVIEINFDENPEAKQLFSGKLDPKIILERLQLFTGQKPEFGKSLLFLDEIQECEAALKSLRYFKEKLPELHIIAAGSLIDFTLEKIGLPVGRIQFLYLHPLSFSEFLIASGKKDLHEFILANKPDPLIHKQILEYLKNYMWLGGMPAVVSAWLKYGDVKKCQSLQDRIVTGYTQDFLKYSRTNQISNVEKVFYKIPTMLGDKLKFSAIDSTIKAASLRSALELLMKAGVVLSCYHSSAQAFPLAAGVNHKKLKMYFFDIGLANRIMGLDLKNWVTQAVDVKYLGGIAEQLVAQEYVAYQDPEYAAELYYWHREHNNSNAEVDFIFTKDNKVIPVEVKAGVKGGFKSLLQFLATHANSDYGIKISQNIIGEQQNIQEIPLYGIEAWLNA